jgi:hypothetical protein
MIELGNRLTGNGYRIGSPWAEDAMLPGKPRDPVILCKGDRME